MSWIVAGVLEGFPDSGGGRLATKNWMVHWLAMVGGPRRGEHLLGNLRNAAELGGPALRIGAMARRVARNWRRGAGLLVLPTLPSGGPRTLYHRLCTLKLYTSPDSGSIEGFLRDLLLLGTAGSRCWGWLWRWRLFWGSTGSTGLHWMFRSVKLLLCFEHRCYLFLACARRRGDPFLRGWRSLPW